MDPQRAFKVFLTSASPVKTWRTPCQSDPSPLPTMLPLPIFILLLLLLILLLLRRMFRIESRFAFSFQMSFTFWWDCQFDSQCIWLLQDFFESKQRTKIMKIAFEERKNNGNRWIITVKRTRFQWKKFILVLIVHLHTGWTYNEVLNPEWLLCRDISWSKIDHLKKYIHIYLCVKKRLWA